MQENQYNQEEESLQDLEANEELESQEAEESQNEESSYNSQRTQKLISLLLVVISAAGFFFYTQPVSNAMDELQTELEPIKQEEQSLLEDLTKLQEAETTFDSKSEVEVFDLFNSIPEKLDQDKLLMDLVEIARSKDIEFKSISFAVGADNSAEVKHVGVNASFEGNYGTLINFLKALEENTRKIVIESISVQILGEAYTGIDRVHFSLAMKAFYRDGI